MRGKIKFLIVLISLLVVGFFAYEGGVQKGYQEALGTPPCQITNENEPEVKGVDFSVFWEAWRRTEDAFLEKDKVDYQKMVYGAVSGMIEALGDPYTVFFDPEKTKEFEQELAGTYEGVGMEVAIKDGQLTVVAPLEGTPAQTAGVRAGDKILKIDNVWTEGVTIDEAVRIIKGPRGTEVVLLIERKDWLQPKEIKIRRELIIIPTLEWELKGGNIALIKIFQFNQLLDSQFPKTAEKILSSSTRKIILDLRNNPGGYLEVAQKVAGFFLEIDEVVALQDSGQEEERKVYKSQGPSFFSNYPMVVLINEGSASGAEILAGSLRDNRQIKLIGVTSFGKGSVQKPVNLSDGSSLKVTIAKWLTPKGISIESKGLEPDIKVELTEDDFEQKRDPQLDKALEILSKY